LLPVVVVVGDMDLDHTLQESKVVEAVRLVRQFLEFHHQILEMEVFRV
jgi:hypothetical protein